MPIPYSYVYVCAVYMYMGDWRQWPSRGGPYAPPDVYVCIHTYILYTHKHTCALAPMPTHSLTPSPHLCFFFPCLLLPPFPLPYEYPYRSYPLFVFLPFERSGSNSISACQGREGDSLFFFLSFFSPSLALASSSSGV